MNPEADARWIIRAGLTVIIGGVLAFGGWAALAPLSGAVIAPGYVKVDLNRKVVQHQEGGIVRAIRVRDGDKVKEGQELVLLDDVRIDAQLDLLRTQLDGERAKAARLEAERSYQPKPKFPKDLAEQPRLTEIIERESALFRARRDAVETQVAVLRAQIKESAQEASALAEQIAAEEKALKLQQTFPGSDDARKILENLKG